MNLLNEAEMKLEEDMTQCLPNLATKLQDAATYALFNSTNKRTSVEHCHIAKPPFLSVEFTT
jgi:hypothetical protein